MIGYTTLGSSDLERSAAFYDPIAAELGAQRIMANDRLILWGTPGRGGMLGVIAPFNGETPSVGNGVMAALAARDPEKVRRIHAMALATGSPDEGAPGMRTDNFYGAYFRDPDGNKLAVFCMTKAPVED